MSNRKKPYKPIEFIIDDKGCHLCTSHSHAGGNYPKITKKGIALHRFVYEQKFGKIPNGLVVRHKCDVKHCINPDHLEVGTIADNNKDKVIRGRERYLIGVDNPAAVLTEKQAIEIFKSISRREDLALQYKVSLSTIHAIKNGDNWGHVTYKHTKGVRRITPNANYKGGKLRWMKD
jgi:hypothetical protein